MSQKLVHVLELENLISETQFQFDDIFFIENRKVSQFLELESYPFFLAIYSMIFSFMDSIFEIFCVCASETTTFSSDFINHFSDFVLCSAVMQI